MVLPPIFNKQYKLPTLSKQYVGVFYASLKYLLYYLSRMKMKTEKHIRHITIKIATGFMAWVLRRCRFRAWASNWNVIYVQKQWFNDSKVLNHELCHAEQIRQDGLFWMPIKYLWYWIRYGQKNNPYELQAKKAEQRLFIDKGNI
jgi:hypothetical protein